MADTSDHSGIDWVQLKKDMDKVATTETGGQRIIRKCKENPFVPIGESLPKHVIKSQLFHL